METMSRETENCGWREEARTEMRCRSREKNIGNVSNVDTARIEMKTGSIGVRGIVRNRTRDVIETIDMHPPLEIGEVTEVRDLRLVLHVIDGRDIRDQGARTETGGLTGMMGGAGIVGREVLDSSFIEA